MTTIGTLIVGAVLSLGTLFGVNSLLGNTANVGGGTGTINQLQQFVATTSPVSAITQAVFGKSFRLSGQSTGCAQFDSNGVLTSTGSSCGGISQWTTSGSDIYYNTGNVGIGTTTPVSQLTVQKTIVSGVDYPALALSRDDNNLSAGDSLGDIDFWSNDGSFDGPGIGSRIRGVSEGTAGRSYGLSLWTRSGDLGTPISEKMRITSTGKVGIGTTTPNAKLSVYSGAAGAYTVNAAADELVLENSSSGGMTIATPDASTGNIFFSSPSRQIGSQLSWNYSNLLMTLGTGVTGGQVQFLAGSATEAMRINASGNVGIGTTTPWTRLAVTGSTTIAGGPLIVLGTSNTPISADTDWYRQFGIFRKDINDYSFMTLENRNGGSNASVDFLFNNDRTTALSYYWDLGFNSSAFNNPAFGLLNVPNAAYEYVTDGPKISATATTSSAGYFDFITGGLSSSRMRITSTGNIGIGTTSPLAKLDIYDASASSAIVLSSGYNTGADSNKNWGLFQSGFNYGDFAIKESNVVGGNPISAGTARLLIQKVTGNVGIGTTSPQSTLSVGSVNDATASYAQIDSVNGAPTAGDCDTDLERGRMIIDYSNNRFYICNGATRGWDYSALTD